MFHLTRRVGWLNKPLNKCVSNLWIPPICLNTNAEDKTAEIGGIMAENGSKSPNSREQCAHCRIGAPENRTLDGLTFCESSTNDLQYPLYISISLSAMC